jgi:hypothetical protein
MMHAASYSPFVPDMTLAPSKVLETSPSIDISRSSSRVVVAMSTRPSLDLGLLVLQYLHFLIFSAFSHEKTGTR